MKTRMLHNSSMYFWNWGYSAGLGVSSGQKELENTVGPR